MGGISNELLKQSNNEELLDAFNKIVAHLKFLNESIINLEEEQKEENNE